MATQRSKRRNFVRDSWRWLCALVRGRLVAARVPAIYGQFSAVDTLSFLQDSHRGNHDPRCMSSMTLDAMWTTFAVRLRELNICVNMLTNLDLFLPSPRRQIDLPQLEVLRFAYIREPLCGGISPDTGNITHLVAFFGSVSLTLQALQIHINPYANRRGDLVAALLPEEVIYPKLRRLDLSIGHATLEQQRHVWRFVQADGPTLRILKLYKAPYVLEKLFDDPPAALVRNWSDGGLP